MKRELDSFLRGLEAESEARLRAIGEEASRRAAEIVAEARAEAERIVGAANRVLEERRAAVRRRIVTHARLLAAHRAQQARTEEVERVFAECGERLAALRSHDDYPGIFERLLNDVLASLPAPAQAAASEPAAARRLLDELGLSRVLSPDELEAASARLLELLADASAPARLREELLRYLGRDRAALVLHVDPRDEALARELVEKRGLRAAVVADIETAGGLVATSADERVVVTNTVEARLERARATLADEVDRALFEGGAE